MLGFRRNLSAQDVMLQLKHQIVDDTSRSTKAILGLDLKKAFDSVEHAAILDRVRSLGLGQRIYNYIRDFLTGRRASVVVGNAESAEFETGPMGTPQGSVVSPMLFNLVLLGLPEKLATIEGLHHSLYADDITLWVPRGGCDGNVERTLQMGVDAVQEFLRGTGLECSAAKSELLLYRPTSRGRKTVLPGGGRSDIRVVTADGVPIPSVDHIRILGLHLQANGHNGEMAPVASEQTAKMPEMVTVEGMDINPDDFDGAGWTTALGARRKRDPAKNAAAPAAAKTTANTAQKDDFNARSRSTVQKVVAASRLPRLPKDQIKVIVRPRGGLDVSKADLVLLARALTMAAALTDQEASEDTICVPEFS
ncbi:uncharacterized protein LOC119395153 [Rhipicephalus sanguineus]|uniref:uncharacterized protein LOC119395153 n=1 Tax=Rhipicephalus sanguineus TaxID=34632 RepID=UPI001895B035|nr:uncharacterized protein LOC119395153 [Rhipicephalus sanguineus]